MSPAGAWKRSGRTVTWALVTPTASGYYRVESPDRDVLGEHKGSDRVVEVLRRRGYRRVSGRTGTRG